MSRRDQDRGAAAVEFALVLPILVVLVFGIVVFGRALNVQATLAGAARVAARAASLPASPTDPGTYLTSDQITAKVMSVAAVPDLTPDQIKASPCTADTTGEDAMVTIKYKMPLNMPLVPEGGTSKSIAIMVPAQGVMRCNG